jgi:hypothetical protein
MRMPGFLAVLMLLSAPSLAQQLETGPATTITPPQRNGETGTRGPSGGSPETGYHGPRDVSKDAEPGKEKSPGELRASGQTPQDPKKK